MRNTIIGFVVGFVLHQAISWMVFFSSGWKIPVISMWVLAGMAAAGCIGMAVMVWFRPSPPKTRVINTALMPHRVGCYCQRCLGNREKVDQRP